MIIPAGGTIDDAFAKIVNTTNKALIPFDGTTVLKSTMNALRGTDRVNRIVLIGPESMYSTPEGKSADEFIPEGKSGPENIFRGLDWLEKLQAPPKQVLIVTADLPFVTSETINNFLDLCPVGYDFCVPLISQDQYLEVYPGSDSTFVKIKDGTWTTGCAYLATTKGLEQSMHHIEKVFQQRKSKLGMARLLGWGFVFKLLLKQLSVSDVEAKVSDLLHVKAKAIPNSPAQLAYDVDFQDDYYYALNALKAHRRSV